MAVDPNLVNILDAVSNAMGKMDSALNQVTDRLNKTSKSIGGYGTFLKPLGPLDARLQKFTERLELIQKLDKTLLNYGTTLHELRTDPALKKLSSTYGTNLFGKTITKALKAGGPILADSLDLGARLEATGQESGNLFEFIKDFRVITGKNIDQQKDLISTIKSNFSRSEELISTLQKLMTDMQRSSLFASKLPTNLTKLIAEVAQGNTGLESQLGEFFQSLLNDSDLARLGVLGPEIQNLVKDFNIALAKGTPGSKDLIAFVRKFSEAPQIKGYTGLAKYFAEEQGIFGIARNLNESLLGEFGQKALLLNNALDATIVAQKEAVNLPKDLAKGYDVALKQLEITVDILDGKMEIFGTNIEELAHSVNQASEEFVKMIRDAEDMSAIPAAVWSGIGFVLDILKDIFESLKPKDKPTDKLCGICELGASCERPVYVKICGDIGRVESPVSVPAPVPAPSGSGGGGRGMQSREVQKEEQTKDKKQDKKNVNYSDWIKNIVPVLLGGELLRRLGRKLIAPKIDLKEFWKEMDKPGKVLELPNWKKFWEEMLKPAKILENPDYKEIWKEMTKPGKVKELPSTTRGVNPKSGYLDLDIFAKMGKGLARGIINLFTGPLGTLEMLGPNAYAPQLSSDQLSEKHQAELQKLFDDYRKRDPRGFSEEQQAAVKARNSGLSEYRRNGFATSLNDPLTQLLLQDYDKFKNTYKKFMSTLDRINPQDYSAIQKEQMEKNLRALKSIESTIIETAPDLRYNGGADIVIGGVLN